MLNLLKPNRFVLTDAQQKETGKPKIGMAKPFCNTLIYDKTKFSEQQYF